MKRIVHMVALLGVLCLLAGCAVGGNTIAAFDFSNADAVAEINLEQNGFGDKQGGYRASEGEGVIVASVNGSEARKLEWSKDDYSGKGMQPVMTGGAKNPWAEGAYLEIRVSTVDAKRVTFSAQIGATKKGPRDYQLQYSIDGVTFANVGEVVSLSENKRLESLFQNVKLPADAAGQETLYIRVAVASNVQVNGESDLYGSTGGETAINHVRVTAI